MAISHNPIFNRSMSTGTAIAKQDLAQAEVDAQFAAITARNPMTVEGTAGKVLGLLALLVISAVVTSYGMVQGWFGSSILVPILGSALVGAALMLWATFSRKVRPGVMVAYSLVEGVFIGAISLLFELMYPGIVQNAVVATFATAGIMFAAYRFGFIKVNARFTRVMTFALLGYMGFAVINLLIGFFTGSAGIYSTPMAWLAGLVGAGLAAFSLNLDFEAIASGARDRLPRENEWRAAFGLTTTLVWLYIEILRLLSIFNRD